MINYYKYLPISNEDVDWGLSVLNAGCTRIEKSEPYPPKNHPAHHYFRWETGRILDEFQIIYILNGTGIFESRSCRSTPVKAGSIIMLFPYEWHRFKPDEEIGWDEYWIGCKGPILNNLTHKHFFTKDKPVMHVGIQEPVMTLFDEVIEKTKFEKSGYQQLISGAVLHLFGSVYSILKEEELGKTQRYDDFVSKAIIAIRSNINANTSIEQLANSLNVGYSSFRKIFKEYTGIAPHQYILQLKLKKAKSLLSDSQKSIKEIASELGFETSFSFSKIFKNKTGVSPNAYRKKIIQDLSNT